MKKTLFIFFTIFIFLFVYSFEFYFFYNSGANNIYTEITGYRDTVFYQIFTDTTNNSDGEVYLKYTVGDGTIQSNNIMLNIAGNIGRRGVIDSDTMGRCVVSWIETGTTYSKVKYSMCEDTQFNFIYSQTIDSNYLTFNEFYDNTSIDVSDDGGIVAIVFNKVFYTISGDSIIFDSTYLFYSISLDSGEVFGPVIKVNDPSKFLIDPDIVVNDSIIYIVYTAENSGAYYMQKCIVDYPYAAASQSFMTIDSSSYNFHPSIISKNDTQYVVYESPNDLYSISNIKISRTNYLNFIDSTFIYSEAEQQTFPRIEFYNSSAPIITYFRKLGDGPGLYYATWNSDSLKFSPNWVTGIGTDANFYCKSDIYVYNNLQFYITLPFNNSSGSFTYMESSKPDAPPDTPDNITVNFDTIYSWTVEDTFYIQWQLPSDFSSIYSSFIKFHNRPNSNFDTTLTTELDSMIYIPTVEGLDSIFIWCMDFRGNLDYRNFGIALIKFDTTSPLEVNKIYPQNNDTVYSRSIDFTYNIGFDSVSGIYEYNAGFGVDSTFFDVDTFLSDTEIILDTTVLFFPLSDGYYYWNVFATDSANNSNDQINNPYIFYLKATPNVNLYSPENNDTINFPCNFIYSQIGDYNSAINSYNIQFADDSLFENIILDTIYGDVSSDTVFNYDFSDYDSLFWRVRWVNENAYMGDFIENRKLYKVNSYIPINLQISYLPLTINVGNDVKINIIANKSDLSFEGSYVIAENFDTLFLDFQADTSNELQYSAEFSTIGMTDDFFSIFIQVDDGMEIINQTINQIKINYPEIWVDNKKIYAWPNPVKGDNINFHIISYDNASINIKIFDLKGNIVREINEDILSGEEKNIAIDIATLNPDLYFVLISINNNFETKIFKNKFVKVK